MLVEEFEVALSSAADLVDSVGFVFELVKLVGLVVVAEVAVAVLVVVTVTDSTDFVALRSFLALVIPVYVRRTPFCSQPSHCLTF